MQPYDLIMLAVLAGATVFGAWKGLAWQLASLSSIFASYFIAFQFREPLAQLIHTSAPWNMFLAMLILYLGSSLVIWLTFRFLSELIDRIKLKGFDRHAGATLGFCRGVLWCAIITLFGVTLLGDRQKQSIIESKSGYYLAILLDRSHSVMPEEVHDVLGPYIHALDVRLEDGQRYAHQRAWQEPSPGAAGQPSPGTMIPAAGGPQPSRPAAGEPAVDPWARRLDELRYGNRR